MKKILSLLIVTVFFSNSLFAGIYIRYYNKDSSAHTWKVKTCGSTKTVTFDSNRTSSLTIQSGCDDAVIYTDCGEITIKDDSKITIKDGCISIN